MNFLETLTRYEPRGLNHEYPLLWDDASAWHVQGINQYNQLKTYIDFTSGIFAVCTGHGNIKVAKAIIEQANRFTHSYIFPNLPRLELVKKLIKITGMEKILLTVTGSEANEAAYQMMLRNRNGRVLSIKGAYYGSTSGIRLLNQGSIDESIFPDSFNPPDIAGVFLQAFRGINARFMPYEWIKEWVNWAQGNNIPVVFDEMQSGIARTGKWFGYQHFDVKPDLICFGKGLGAGMPITAVAGKAELFEYADDLWSTHTGNPICCAAALASLEEIEERNLIEKTAHIGEWFGKELWKRFPQYGIYGKGLIWAIDLGDAQLAERVVDKCAEGGLLMVKTHANTLKIAPPLVIPKEALLEGLDILKGVIECQFP